MSERLRVGVVGLRFGRQVVETLAQMDDVTVVAVADSRPERVTPSIDEFCATHGCRWYADGLELIAAEDLDGVVLTVTPRRRRPLLEAGLKRELGLLIEKPWAANIEQGRELLDLCRGATRPLAVDFALRYHPPVDRLLELMAGELGEPRLLCADLILAWIPPADHWAWDPANGNGLLNENAVHMFATTCALLGRPLELYARGGAYHGSPFEEGATMTIAFEGGRAASLTVGGLGAKAFRMPPRFNLCCANGQAHLTGLDHMFDHLRWAVGGGELQEEAWQPPLLANLMRYALRDWLDCLRTGAEPKATIELGHLATCVAMAVRRSIETGQVAPVVT